MCGSQHLSVQLLRLNVYRDIKLSASQPFKVTWHHRSRYHSTRNMWFPLSVIALPCACDILINLSKTYIVSCVDIEPFIGTSKVHSIYVVSIGYSKRIRPSLKRCNFLNFS